MPKIETCHVLRLTARMTLGVSSQSGSMYSIAATLALNFIYCLYKEAFVTDIPEIPNIPELSIIVRLAELPPHPISSHRTMRSPGNLCCRYIFQVRLGASPGYCIIFPKRVERSLGSNVSLPSKNASKISSKFQSALPPLPIESGLPKRSDWS
jgi:hypothetical protein